MPTKSIPVMREIQALDTLYKWNDNDTVEGNVSEYSETPFENLLLTDVSINGEKRETVRISIGYARLKFLSNAAKGTRIRVICGEVHGTGKKKWREFHIFVDEKNATGLEKIMRDEVQDRIEAKAVRKIRKPSKK